jgi:endogenous inhibitor of DNA gyrase (YacG/DUF329 family)
MNQDRQYEDLQATQIYCPQCRTAMPVRERLLLVLPDGDLYEISCARCGTSVARQTRTPDEPAGVVMDPNRLRRPVR